VKEKLLVNSVGKLFPEIGEYQWCLDLVHHFIETAAEEEIIEISKQIGKNLAEGKIIQPESLSLEATTEDSINYIIKIIK